MRALDVYSGIGGWSCGLRLAGIDVVGSFERWPVAVDTNNTNNGGSFEPVDVRMMDLGNLPSNIDLVVGSPPCTQFSYSNRGGDGDLDEGLKDVVRFLDIVRALRPRFWAMENVPRVAKILSSGFEDSTHVLYSYRDLRPQIRVLDLSRYGAPQVRKRCIAGNIPFDVLSRLSADLRATSLGDVVRSLRSDEEITDPVWGIRCPAPLISERQTETPLTDEELRLNREAKEHHPVYNNMAFPDCLDGPARTVTATCTRVSRESIIIFDETISAYRRLSIRERASLQGFPITYQFYSPSYSHKVKMIGNAVPPTFSFMVGLAVQRLAFPHALDFSAAAASLTVPERQPPITKPDWPSGKYRGHRRFRAAIPGLRFKSGVRFELRNEFSSGDVSWVVKFVHGTPKDIRELELKGAATAQLRGFIKATYRDEMSEQLLRAEQRLKWLDSAALQAAWTRKQNGIGPFEVVDLLANCASFISGLLSQVPGEQLEQAVLGILDETSSASELPSRPIPRVSKLRSHAVAIASGLIVSEWFNCFLRSDEARIAA